MSDVNLKEVSSHFGFGENWKSFTKTITEESISKAKADLARLLPNDEIRNASFFDIGCGSGLSMVAAKQLGAAQVRGIDIDENSVEASKLVLSQYVPEGGWSSTVKSVFNVDKDSEHLHDIVHSWGVLHHTGDMWQAIETAIGLVKPKGLFVIALYRKTPLCSLWEIEKKIYTKAPSVLKLIIALVYKFLYIVGLLATFRNPWAYIDNYKSNRGMDWHHDVIDWIGGYPYQSVTPNEVRGFFEQHGFALVRCFEKKAACFGVFGTHCDEFVFVRR